MKFIILLKKYDVRGIDRKYTYESSSSSCRIEITLYYSELDSLLNDVALEVHIIKLDRSISLR
jgi:hypothetical protein